MEVNSAQYWDKTYNYEMGKDLDQRTDIILYNMILDFITDNKKVMDFGSGRGDFLVHLLQNREGIEAYAVDISQVGLDESKRRDARINISKDLPEEEKFDVITSLHVIEHFEEPEKIIDDLRKHLKKDGLLIITLPLEDTPWIEHPKIWHKEDMEELFKGFNCECQMILRNERIIPAHTKRNPQSIPSRMVKKDGTPSKEVIIITKFEEDGKVIVKPLEDKEEQHPFHVERNGKDFGFQNRPLDIEPNEESEEGRPVRSYTSKDLSEAANKEVKELKEYSKSIKELEYDKFYLPIDVYIEVTNFCNAECFMCPNKDLKREKGIMSWDLYTSIIDQCAEFENEGLVIHLHKDGEPLMDPLFADRVKYARKKLRKDVLKRNTLIFNTNASLLTPEKSKAILDAGIDCVIFSLDAVTATTYELMRGLNYNSVIKNIEYFLAYKEKMKLEEVEVTFQFVACDKNKNEVRSFMKEWEGRAGKKTRIVIKPMHDFLTKGTSILTKEKTEEQQNICYQPFLYLMIYWNGDLALCCWDADHAINLGNAKQEPLLKLFNSSKYKEIRKAMLNKDCKAIIPCKDCSQIYGEDMNQTIHNKKARYLQRKNGK